MKFRPWIGFGVLAAAAGVAILPAPSHAKEMRLIWTTFMRNYPNVHAMVIDEIRHDTVIDVLGCNADNWCKVEYGRASGYIEASALFGDVGSPALRAPLNPSTGCFEANLPAYIGERGEVFCGVHSSQPPSPEH